MFLSKIIGTCTRSTYWFPLTHLGPLPLHNLVGQAELIQ